ncbi:hypothetical protein TBK1r_11080 [Stieleria magnilauensis]|uniref:Uncharacterized protein n=1 Tax=Stieleria magnilauensis TaxID=2527963 RepID=A0ABX5XJL6_9BACT|nr:hypothetical protein TBK1r_11080 [Planctomycetes bacterium TBK1r]
MMLRNCFEWAVFDVALWSQLGANLSPNFLAVDADRIRCSDAQPNAVTVNSQYFKRSDLAAETDNNPLTLFS